MIKFTGGQGLGWCIMHTGASAHSTKINKTSWLSTRVLVLCTVHEWGEDDPLSSSSSIPHRPFDEDQQHQQLTEDCTIQLQCICFTVKFRTSMQRKMIIHNSWQFIIIIWSSSTPSVLSMKINNDTARSWELRSSTAALNSAQLHSSHRTVSTFLHYIAPSTALGEDTAAQLT